MKAALPLALAQPRFDLRPRAVHQHELHPERCEQVQVMSEIEESPIGDEVAAESNDENLAAERMDVGGDRLEPVDEAILGGETLTPHRMGSIGTRAVPVRVVLTCRDRVLLQRAATVARILCEIPVRKRLLTLQGAGHAPRRRGESGEGRLRRKPWTVGSGRGPFRS